MKIGLLISLIFLSILSLTFVYSQEQGPTTCQDLGYECGTWDNPDHQFDFGKWNNPNDQFNVTCRLISGEFCGETSEECIEKGYRAYVDYVCKVSPLMCGECDNGACISGKCYNFNELGECVALFPDQACSEFREDCLRNRCGWENWKIYSTHIYWKSDQGIRWKGDEFSPEENSKSLNLLISIDDDMLLNPQDINIPVQMVVEKSWLPPGTRVSLKVRPWTSETFITSILAIVTENKEIRGNWNITGEDLTKLNYSGFIGLTFRIVNITTGEEFPRPGRINYFGTVEVSPQQGDLYLQSKKGECSGVIPCSAFSSSKSACGETTEHVLKCKWDEEASSCIGEEGEEGVSCGIIGEYSTCRFYECSWKGNSAWETFKSWIKYLFSNLFG